MIGIGSVGGIVVGIGARRGVSAAEVRAALQHLAGLVALDGARYASVDAKAVEQGILDAIAPARLETRPAAVLAGAWPRIGGQSKGVPVGGQGTVPRIGEQSKGAPVGGQGTVPRIGEQSKGVPIGGQGTVPRIGGQSKGAPVGGRSGGGSARVEAAVGTPSVAEAAALVVAGPGAVLLVPKTVVGRVTVACASGQGDP